MKIGMDIKRLFVVGFLLLSSCSENKFLKNQDINNSFSSEIGESIKTPIDSIYNIIVVLKKSQKISKLPKNTVAVYKNNEFFYKKGEVYLKDSNETYKMEIRGIAAILKDAFKGSTQQYTYTKSSSSKSDSIAIGSYIKSDTLYFKGNPFSKKDFKLNVYEDDFLIVTKPFSDYLKDDKSKICFEIEK